MRHYRRVCGLLASTLFGASILLMLIISAALAAQVLFRYVLNSPLSSTDEIAQNAMVWMTFLGAAFLYRERGHVEIDMLVKILPPPVARILALLVEIAIAVTLVVVAMQVLQTRPLMQRVLYGQLQVSKFALHMVPLFIGSIATVMFVLERVIDLIRGADTATARPAAVL